MKKILLLSSVCVFFSPSYSRGEYKISSEQREADIQCPVVCQKESLTWIHGWERNKNLILLCTCSKEIKNVINETQCTTECNKECNHFMEGHWLAEGEAGICHCSKNYALV